MADGWLHRVQRLQPLAAPSDVRRYFVSPEESGQICMLACILGRPGEVFFPKLGEDQMLTFSSICDDFVKAEGFTKKECSSDAEAKAYAAEMSSRIDGAARGELSSLKLSRVATEKDEVNESRDLNTAVAEPVEAYPVVYFKSDTTGEKAYEEFYVPGEKLDMSRFASLGVVEQTQRHTFEEVTAFFEKLEAIFQKEDFTKAEVVEAIKMFIPNFAHEEKGKNLDSKM